MRAISSARMPKSALRIDGAILTMRPITLVLIIHDHQPVGNFDGVFRQAYLDAYQPFLHFLETRPPLRLALHTSGPLLQWLALHEPSYLTRLAALVQ